VNRKTNFFVDNLQFFQREIAILLLGRNFGFVRFDFVVQRCQLGDNLLLALF
jgi:hypothetical protein